MVKISKLGVRTVSALRSASPLTSPSGLARRLVLAGLLAPVLLATGLTTGLPATVLPATGALASTARTADPAPAPDFRHACSTATSPGHEVCQALVQTGGVTHAGLVRDSVPGGYGPADLQSAYSLTQAAAAAGRGQTVAIVDAFDDPNAASDLALYRSQYHLPPCAVASGCFRKVNQEGNASPLPRAAGKTGWDEEESLDLDMVSATCPNCRIILVEANSAEISDLGTGVNAAVSLGAKFVSNSYNGPERASDTTDDNAYFKHPGVALTAAGGDSGYGVGYPAASRYVTSVGGTSLVRRSGTARGWSETVWNDASGATGSGCSARDAKPSWQTDTGCPRRTDNDVAAIANPETGVAVYDTYGSNHGWQVFGGTSAATPIIAATYALAGPAASGAYPAQFPYLNTSRLHDITSGSDGSCGGSYLCTAKAGFDGPTGWGTPDGTGAFQATDHKVTVTSPGTRHSTRGKKIASVRIKAKDSASAQTLRFTASRLPPGLSISTSGVISGTPKARGFSSVTVRATDGTGMTGSVSFTWSVASVGAVRSQLARKCVDDRNGSTADGTRIQIYTCHGGQAQVWTAHPNAAGKLQLRLTKATSVARCLTVPGNRTAAGTKVELLRCNSSAGQEWQARGNGHLVNPRSGKCLADPGAGPIGTQLEIVSCAVRAAQHWALP
jgi:Ricin-type beta-trefoil lectin domain/Putative Ig domain